MMDKQADSMVDVGLNGSAERLCPDGASSVNEHRNSVSDVSTERERRNQQCCWVLLLVPSCSLILTAALATLTVGALMAPSCSVQAQYEAPCRRVREAIINSTTTDFLLPGSSFEVLSADSTHVTVRHNSPVNGAQYHIYFLLKKGANESCTCLSLAASTIWFHPDDAGAGLCALQHLTSLGLTARNASAPTCNAPARNVCQLPAHGTAPTEAPSPSPAEAPSPVGAPSPAEAPSPVEAPAPVGAEALSVLAVAKTTEASLSDSPEASNPSENFRFIPPRPRH